MILLNPANACDRDFYKNDEEYDFGVDCHDRL
jgi:hypothetical protein